MTVEVRDIQGEQLDGVALTARSIDRERVLPEDSVRSVNGRGSLKVFTLHRFSIGAQLRGYVPVTLGPTYPSWQQHVTVVIADFTEMLATRDRTGGALGLVRQTIAPKSGPPTHIHQAEDEFFYVVSGDSLIGFTRCR